MPHLLRHVRLDHIALTSPDPEALAMFYGRALDMAVERRGGEFLAFGPDRKVVFKAGAAGDAAYSAYAFPDAQSLGVYRATIEDRGVETLASPSSQFGADAFAVADPDGAVIVFGARQQASRYLRQSGRLRGRLQHFVTATTAIDPVATFYRDSLGFIVSDEVRDDEGGLRSIFLRTDAEHHSRAIFLSRRTGLDHHCYEAGDWALLRDWGDRMADAQTPLHWGPGRHGPGHNLFFMVRDPDGNWIEVSAELDLMQEGAPAGVWRHEARTLNSWGQAFLRS
ncbi:VOC family protein [Phenylobacterium montanum]|uniref:VOC family protein n=1 Tax=Phenylobacterium montanum TaxID=2823693 RepID=A0A975G3R8_9CAUL|nr:VOC family protein [Caulobacter sp. S6]QUD90259.1 VOC family protein [Caulobacter sp. S6]